MAPTPLHPQVSIVIICNCCHFATDCCHAVKMLIFYCHHFQLWSLYNLPSSGVCPIYNIPSVGIKGTSSVLWSSAKFYSISQNMHYKVPAASQHCKTNKVVWKWKDDWPPWRTSTYKRPFTWEGNYLVLSFNPNCGWAHYNHPSVCVSVHVNVSVSYWFVRQLLDLSAYIYILT